MAGHARVATTMTSKKHAYLERSPYPALRSFVMSRDTGSPLSQGNTLLERADAKAKFARW